MPEAKIAENNVTMQTLISLETLVFKQAIDRLSRHLFKVNDLPFIEKIKTKRKIRKIVDFFTDFKRHNTHVMPFFSDELLSIGLPVKKAEPELDEKLRKIRNICEEITTTEWHNENEIFFVRKIYFSGKNWYILKCRTQ